MIVVSDTSPLLTLWKIGQLNLLHVLYGEVVIPPEVENEIRADEHPDSAKAIFDACQGWLTVRSPASTQPIRGLDPGEISAIALAKELKADLLLIDEKLGRRIAAEQHLPIRGTIGVLEEARCAI